MKRDDTLPKYASEAELCAQLMEHAAANGWTPYPETAGWDILLVRKSDGYQIGVQAKLQANLEVVCQTIKRDDYWHTSGPDYRAILVPGYAGKIGQLQALCPYLGVTIIAGAPGAIEGGMVRSGYGRVYAFRPDLPDTKARAWGGDDGEGRVWFEQCPSKRCTLPEYVPDVPAGVSAPVQLTRWKIGAIKVAIILERRGHIKRSDFKHLQIDHRRWIASGPSSILVPDPPKGFRAADGSTPGLGFKKEHPRNYEEIAADFDKWAPAPYPFGAPSTQLAL